MQAEFAAAVRRFAPFADFGLWFEGDAKSRGITKSNEGQGGFSTSADVTSRTSMTLLVDGAAQMSEAHASPSRHPIFGEKTATVRVIDKGAVASSADGMLDSHSAGANPLIPLHLAPDIDSDLQLAYELRGGTLTVDGTVWGDKFPNAEAFISDRQGNTQLLGTFDTKEGVLPGGVSFAELIGPLTLVRDDSRTPDDELMSFHVEIPVDAQGNFLSSSIVRSP